MIVGTALAVDSLVTLPVAPNVWTALERNAVVPGLVVAGVAANDVAVPGMRVVTRQEAGGCVTGGE